MSLPTPPSTSHRDKENRLPLRSRISWSRHNEYHCLSTSPPPKQPLKPSGACSPPTKSILKRSTYVPLPFADDDDSEANNQQREVTPEPADPLTNLSYLANSVDKIVASNDTSSLKDLIQAYSVLTARLKGAVNGTTDADASWPLFQPLRRHREAVVNAFIRDLGRALVNPDTADAECEQGRVLLPSPQHSPKRKKGMSAEQVKYARDLCTTCHAVIKLLAVIFTLPAIYRVFTDDQLRQVLTQALAIPLSDELPTPNARKTCALSIWLIQSQRLPSEVLIPANDRIAYALQRGIEGELGKEGKKGSANDGLKAIHELSVYQPATFLPAFITLLPSILANLLAPTLTLRNQACHALGGLVLGLTSLPACPATSILHARVSASIATFLTISTSPSKSSLSSPSRDPMIIRTLRTTLQATDPQQAAQGPVWALTVLANLTVLLGSKLYTDVKLCRMVAALLSLSMRHKKSSVRGLGCLVWRCVAWVWFQPPFSKGVSDNEMEVDEAGKEKKQSAREAYWRIVKSVVDIGAGVATIAALLNDDSSSSSSVIDEDMNLKRVMQVMRCMIKKGGQTCGEAMEVLKIFVSSDRSSPSPSSEWTPNKLLPPSLFNALPGLLSAEYKGLLSAVKPIFDQCPQLEDVRSLTREEIAKEWVFDELVDIWRKGLCYLELPEDCGTPAEVVAVWEGLLVANVSVLQDDDAGIAQFAIRAVDILVDVLQDADIDLTTKSGPPRKALSSSSPIRVPPSSHSNTALKISITRDLWTTTRTTIPLDFVTAAGEKLLGCLVNNEDEWVWHADSSDDARKQWAMFCAEALIVCDLEELRQFWGTDRDAGSERKKAWSREPEVRKLVWDCFVQKWKAERNCSLEGAIVLLSVPFVDTSAWDLHNDGFETWDDFLGFAVNKAFDYGVDCSMVLDQVAFAISQNPTPAFEDAARIADLLLMHLEIKDARQMPSVLFDFVNDILQSAYPPEPRNKITSIWLLRSLTRIIDACPIDLALKLLDIIQDGVSLWISDSYEVFTEREYEDEIVPMYQTILFGIQSLPRTVETLETVSGIVGSAFCGGTGKLDSVCEAFTNFWKDNYSSLKEPTSGWPETLQICLRAIAAPADDVSMIDPILLAEKASAYNAAVSMQQEDATADDTFEVPMPNDASYTLPESEDGQELPVLLLANKVKEPESIECLTPVKSSPLVGQLEPAFAMPAVTEFHPAAVTPNGQSAEAPLIDSTQPPLTPAKEPLLTFTPPRPIKSFTPATFLTFPIGSPATPLPSSQRTTATPKCTPLSIASGSRSPSKRQLEDDKENMSPHPIIPSLTDRLALRSPVWSTKDTVLGKRRAVYELQKGSPIKKGKAVSGMSIGSPPLGPVIDSDDSEDEWLTERTLVDLDTNDTPKQSLPVSLSLDDPFRIESDTSTSTSYSSSSPKKRKRLLMDAVEVPTLREIMIRERNVTAKRVIRRTRSATAKSFGLSSIQSSIHESTENSKKQLDHGSSEDFSTSPSRVLEDMKVIGSDDSIIWVQRTQFQATSELSSDDDPYFGQVTPHHLISPVLCRVQGLTSDPPSDDSNMSTSPSHELASRRRLRLTSFSYLKSTAA